uniref:Uncharacterized protein n=1 Tax=Lacticaseibacillus paracasei TaxID=1597 RepID=R9WTH8_LACPA|nr:hypothetical protein [Lacticaseibacillus paracasei]
MSEAKSDTGFSGFSATSSLMTCKCALLFLKQCALTHHN